MSKEKTVQEQQAEAELQLTYAELETLKLNTFTEKQEAIRRGIETLISTLKYDTVSKENMALANKKMGPFIDALEVPK